VLLALYSMDYLTKTISIKELNELIESQQIDLNPSYQRNFIWSKADQSDLIDTILKRYPVPSIFLYKKPSGLFEMVDGQQRSKTIYRFFKGLIHSSKKTGKKYLKDCDKNMLLDYQIPIIELSNLNSNESLNEFYTLINKKGKSLTPPEVSKSEYHNSLFLQLNEELLDLQIFKDLDLFTEATTKRMNDRAFVEELLVFLFFDKITDKKGHVIKIYEKDITQDEYEDLKTKFINVISKVFLMNKIYPLKKTRYRQKNDFYTLFCFIHKNLDSSDQLLESQYKTLLILNKKDREAQQLISPSNEDCSSLREYAINCVSQSNSKEARLNRLEFFNAILKQKHPTSSDLFTDVFNYLSDVFGDQVVLKQISGFQQIAML